MDTDPWWSALR